MNVQAKHQYCGSNLQRSLGGLGFLSRKVPFQIGRHPPKVPHKGLLSRTSLRSPSFPPPLKAVGGWDNPAAAIKREQAVQSNR